MIKYFSIPCKFIKVTWGELDKYDEVYYISKDRPDDLNGPFLVIEKRGGILMNMGGVRIETDRFIHPISLWQKIS